MRLLLAAPALLLLLATAASAGPALPVRVTPSLTLPSDDCGSCVEAGVAAGTVPPPGCYDCDSIGAAVGLEHGEEGTTASARVCKGGFVYFCVIDEEVTV